MKDVKPGFEMFWGKKLGLKDVKPYGGEQLVAHGIEGLGLGVIGGI